MSLSYDRHLVDRFLREEHIEETDELGGFAYRLNLSVPAIATAIHAGHRVRDELLPLMALDEEGRLFEEDAATDELIKGLPSAVWGLDSRAEYDLNRPPDSTLPLTPEQFWGIRVYRDQPSDAMNQKSMAKFHAFYRFLTSYLQALIERHGACVVYDIHSYNITRQVEKGFENPPVFNLGTVRLNKNKWGDQIEAWLQRLKSVNLPSHDITVAENQVFFGRAYLTSMLTASDPNILVLPTEVSKIYMNELDGGLKPIVFESLKQGLQEAVKQHSHTFAQSLKQIPHQN